MGALRLPLPQGPNQHCSRPELHDMHMNDEPGTFRGSHCDGVPVLEPFVELVVRVPLEVFEMGEETHEEMLEAIREEGIGTFCIDPIYDGIGRAALRVRWGGKDVVYPLVDGKLP